MESNLNRVLNQSRHQLSGQLYKYTNVVKGQSQLLLFHTYFINSMLIQFVGWQYRWFTVDAQAGVLSYYLCDGSNDETIQIIGNSPRGQVSKNEHLITVFINVTM